MNVCLAYYNNLNLKLFFMLFNLAYEPLLCKNRRIEDLLQVTLSDQLNFIISLKLPLLVLLPKVVLKYSSSSLLSLNAVMKLNHILI